MNKVPHHLKGERVTMTMAELDALPHAVCKKCGFEHFIQAFRLKKVSPILSQSGQTEVIPQQTFICGMCHYQLKPEDMKNATKKPEPELPNIVA